MRAFFENQYYDLILKKTLSIEFSTLSCYFELLEEGKEVFILTLIYENPKGISEQVIQHLEELEPKNLLIDRLKNQVFLAKKYAFCSLTPQTFSFRVAQFVSYGLHVKKKLGENKDKEFVFIKKK